MTVVIDASAFVHLLVGRIDPAEAGPFDDDLTAPDFFLVETAAGLRRSELGGIVSAAEVTDLLVRVLATPVELVPASELLERAFELRHNVTVADACYVALAEHLDCALITADGRLARAPGVDVRVTLV